MAERTVNQATERLRQTEDQWPEVKRIVEALRAATPLAVARVAAGRKRP